MHNLSGLIWACGAGLFLGFIFFGGLLWTVRKGVESAHPAKWFFGSLLLRISLVMAGFFFIGQGSMWRLGACLVGFLLARILITQCSAMSAGKGAHEPES